MASVELRNLETGSWRIIAYDGYNPDGTQKRVRRTFHADPNSTEKAQRKQAERYAARLQTELDDKKVNDAKKISFRAAYEDYIQDRIERRGLAKRTIDSYKKLFESRLIPEFGNKAIREITPADLNSFLRKLSGDRKEQKKKQDPAEKNKKLSGTYCLKYFQQLNELFTYAQKNGIIVINPCDLVEAPKRDTKEAQYYDLPECAKIVNLLSACSDPIWKAFFSLEFYCGCRPGELVGLNWSDYDGENIMIQAGSYQAKGSATERTEKPKTKKSIRRIQLTPEAASALEAWKREQAAQRLKAGKCWFDKEAVFTNIEGIRISVVRPTKAWKRFTRDNGLRHLPLYDLRHTNISLLIASRELSVEEVAARAGHEQTSTTLNIYTHAFSNANARATSALTNVLKKAAEQ